MTHQAAHRLVFGAAALLLCAAAPAPPAWNLLERQANGGIASVLHGLTKDQCDFALARIEGEPATAEEKATQASERAAADQRQEDFDRSHHCSDASGGDSSCSSLLPLGSPMQSHLISGTDVIGGECFQ